jgi:hypothetical protein
MHGQIIHTSVPVIAGFKYGNVRSQIAIELTLSALPDRSF